MKQAANTHFDPKRSFDGRFGWSPQFDEMESLGPLIPNPRHNLKGEVEGRKARLSPGWLRSSLRRGGVNGRNGAACKYAVRS